MTAGRAEFGPVRIAWTDAAASPASDPETLGRLGDAQVRRHAGLSGLPARRFLTGRALLVSLISELTDAVDLGFTTTCERCGAEHGRPRLERAPIVVSISYSGSLVAVAAAHQTDAAAVGVDIERVPADGAGTQRRELAALFAPAPPPDTEGWTLLEAALKADGRGTMVDLDEVHIGAIGTGRLAGSRAVRIPSRADPVDAGAIAAPPGFVLSAAMVPAVGERHPS